MKKIISMFCACLLLGAGTSAHTSAETNEMSRLLVEDLLVMEGDDIRDQDYVPPAYVSPAEYYGGTNADGWSPDEKNGLLSAFVSAQLAKRSFVTNTVITDQMRFAIERFGLMRMTNAVPVVRLAWCDPSGMLRTESMNSLLHIWGPSTSATALVRSVVTNHLAYTKHERSEAYNDYLYRFLCPSRPNAFPYVNEEASKIAVAYAFRADATNTAPSAFAIDNFLAKNLPGYANSLERLTNVVRVLSRPDCTQPDLEYFGPIRTALEALPAAQRTVVPDP